MQHGVMKRWAKRCAQGSWTACGSGWGCTPTAQCSAVHGPSTKGSRARGAVCAGAGARARYGARHAKGMALQGGRRQDARHSLWLGQECSHRWQAHQHIDLHMIRAAGCMLCDGGHTKVGGWATSFACCMLHEHGQSMAATRPPDGAACQGW